MTVYDHHNTHHHLTRPSDMPGPAMPTARSGSHRSSAIAVIPVAGLFVVIGMLLHSEVRGRGDHFNAQTAQAIVIDVADRVNSGGDLAPGEDLMNAIYLELTSARATHQAPETSLSMVTDVPQSAGDADAAYLVDVDGQLACLLLHDGRLDAYAAGDNVTLSGPSDVAPDRFDCDELA